MFPLFWETRSNIFWKISLRQGATSFFGHTFRSIMMGWVIKIDDIAAKPVKSRIPAVFEGDFQSPKKSNFIDDIAFLELKNDFRAVRWKKISLPFFISENRQKSGFPKYNHFWKKFVVCKKEINFILKETVSLLIRYEMFFLKERRNSDITKKFILWKPTKLTNLQKMKKGMRMKENEIKALKVKPHEHPEV